MTISRYGRGTCPDPECGRSISLRKDGTIGRHGDKKTWPPQDCAGYTDKRKPKEGESK